jgi:hypothetical protein
MNENAVGVFGTARCHPVGMCGGAFIRKQYDDYGEAIRESNIKAE